MVEYWNFFSYELPIVRISMRCGEKTLSLGTLKSNSRNEETLVSSPFFLYQVQL